MNGSELLQALMDAAGDNAYAVATSLKKPALQSYIWKFLNGKAKEPRRASLQPLADRYRVPVDAFYDPSLAERIAGERGLLVGRPASASSSTESPSSSARPDTDEVVGALRILASALQPADKATRLAVAPLLSLLASDPSQEENVLSALSKLLPRTIVARTSQHDESTGLTVDLGTGRGLKPSEQRDRVQAQQGKR